MRACVFACVRACVSGWVRACVRMYTPVTVRTLSSAVKEMDHGSNDHFLFLSFLHRCCILAPVLTRAHLQWHTRWAAGAYAQTDPSYAAELWSAWENACAPVSRACIF